MKIKRTKTKKSLTILLFKNNAKLSVSFQYTHIFHLVYIYLFLTVKRCLLFSLQRLQEPWQGIGQGFPDLAAGDLAPKKRAGSRRED